VVSVQVLVVVVKLGEGCFRFGDGLGGGSLLRRRQMRCGAVRLSHWCWIS
jgi:hypothetical protein